MASRKMTNKWTRLRQAVSDRRWTDAQAIADDLCSTIEQIVVARRGRGHLSERARAVNREGLYVIGWQLLFHAPESVRESVMRFNRAVRRLPGGIGGPVIKDNTTGA